MEKKDEPAPQWRRGGSFRKLEVEKFADENSEPESDGHYYYTPPACESIFRILKYTPPSQLEIFLP